MNNILTIGYICEGKTDRRLLSNIIRKTFEELAFECKGQIEVYEPEFIASEGNKFVEKVTSAAKKAKWANILCVHTDSDSESDDEAFNFRINPAFEYVKEEKGNLCKNLVAIVPIQMSEAWMLADSELLLEEIGANDRRRQLNLPRQNQIERKSDPKSLIEEILRITNDSSGRRRSRLTISELYTPISQKINLDHLKNLSAFDKFYQNAKKALVRINYY